MVPAKENLMNRRTRFIQATCVAVLCSVGAVRTQAATLPSALASLDPDNDGTVSIEEAKAAAVKKFNAIDTDHEGTLSPEEAKDVITQSAFTKADPDKDGTIDKAEWAALVEQNFKGADPDRDGTLDAKELESPEGKQLLKMLQ
jgi:Ca2+-binding EF-hand superfamily protein